MPPTNWTDEAVKCSAEVARTMPPPRRGVMALEEHTGVFAIYAPEKELNPIKEKLAGAGIKVLGEGSSLLVPDDCVVAVLVQASDDQKLAAIVNSKGRRIGD